MVAAQRKGPPGPGPGRPSAAHASACAPEQKAKAAEVNSHRVIEV